MLNDRQDGQKVWLHKSQRSVWAEQTDTPQSEHVASAGRETSDFDNAAVAHDFWFAAEEYTTAGQVAIGAPSL